MNRSGPVALTVAVLIVAGCAPDGDADLAPTVPTTSPTEPAATTEPSPTTGPATTPAETGPTTSAAAPTAIATVPAADSVLAVIAGHPDLTVFGVLVGTFVETGQGSVFTQARGLTVMAPTDDAMARLGDDSLRTLIDDPDALARWMSSHMAVGVAAIGDVAGGVVLNAAGQSLPVGLAPSTIDGHDVVDADLAADNGVVHVIDGVITAVN